MARRAPKKLLPRRESSQKFKWAAKMRKYPTPAEKAARIYLNKMYLYHGWPRAEWQVVILGYIVDAFFREANLALEIDGPIHQKPGRMQYDKDRERHLIVAGFGVHRVTNEGVLENQELAFQRLGRELERFIVNRHHKPTINPPVQDDPDGFFQP